jgi:hypothetical protein
MGKITFSVSSVLFVEKIFFKNWHFSLDFEVLDTIILI